MKTIQHLSFAIMLATISGMVCSQTLAGNNSASQKELVTVQCSPDLYPMASTWAAAFCNLNPGKHIKVEATASNVLVSGSTGNLSFISSNLQTAPPNEKMWRMVIGRDIIVPVVNTSNPLWPEIIKSGISPEMLSGIFANPDRQNWNILFKDAGNAPIHLYVPNDDATRAAVAKFLGLKQLPVSGISFGTGPEVLSAIQKDPNALAFCKLVSVIDPVNQKIIEKVRLLPIDKNGNGTIDYMEDIYANMDVFMRGVWIGKYPKTLFSNIYAVSALPPDNATEIAFLSWVLTTGQQYMNTKGFVELAENESQLQLEKINSTQISVAPVYEASQTGIIFLILAGILALGIIVGLVIRSYRKQADVTPLFFDEPKGFTHAGIKLPQGLYYDKTHTWAFMEKDGNVTVGIDDFLQHVTGSITRVEMKNPGDRIKKGELLLSVIQSGKQLQVYSPLTGTIKKQNEILKSQASFLNTSPYSEGWVYQLEPSGWVNEIQRLDMAGKYRQWIENEFIRLKDFLASTLNPASIAYSHAVMQDGGLMKEGVLAEFGPEVWDDFQTNFLDLYK